MEIPPSDPGAGRAGSDHQIRGTLYDICLYGSGLLYLRADHQLYPEPDGSFGKPSGVSGSGTAGSWSGIQVRCFAASDLQDLPGADDPWDVGDPWIFQHDPVRQRRKDQPLRRDGASGMRCTRAPFGGSPFRVLSEVSEKGVPNAGSKEAGRRFMAGAKLTFWNEASIIERNRTMEFGGEKRFRG